MRFLVQGKLLSYSDRTKDGAGVMEVHLEGAARITFPRPTWASTSPSEIGPIIHSCLFQASSWAAQRYWRKSHSWAPCRFHCRFMVSDLKLTLHWPAILLLFCSKSALQFLIWYHLLLSPQSSLLHTPPWLTHQMNKCMTCFSIFNHSLKLISTYYWPGIILGRTAITDGQGPSPCDTYSLDRREKKIHRAR